MASNDLEISGLHHVTAITSDAQKNINFYCNVLGLRLVKVTVNFDDPGSYHLYYGDELGRPGTILTFFAWPDAPRGRIGPAQVSATAFAVPQDALGYWATRLKENAVQTQETSDRFGDKLIAFEDPDGMRLEIVGVTRPAGTPWAAGPIPEPFAIRGFHSITISEEGHARTASLLTDVMGFTAIGSEHNRFRYRSSVGDGFASLVDLLCVPGAPHGSLGAGVVHHVAFRTADSAQQNGWRNAILRDGFNVSPVMDRTYFHSIYFREPGGVLFEIATDNPGFATDETPAQLGAALRLPAWLEAHRTEIERSLPAIHVPGGAIIGAR